MIALIGIVPRIVNAACDPTVATRLLKGDSQYGVGVLVEDIHGKKHLALTYFAGSLHTFLLQRLHRNVEIRSLLWMGEMRYRRDKDNKIQIIQANETSGYFKELREKGLKLGGRDIIISNNSRALPMSVRAPDFEPIEYNPLTEHLATPASQLTKDPDIRHEIGNILALFTSGTRNLLHHSSDAAEITVRHLRQEQNKPIKTLLRLIESVVHDSRLRPSDVENLVHYLHALENPLVTWQMIIAMPLEQIAAELKKVNDLISGPANLEIEIISLE